MAVGLLCKKERRCRETRLCAGNKLTKKTQRARVQCFKRRNPTMFVFDPGPPSMQHSKSRKLLKGILHTQKEFEYKLCAYLIKTGVQPSVCLYTRPAIKIGDSCMCQDTTECVFVHQTDYEDQASTRREYDLMR